VPLIAFCAEAALASQSEGRLTVATTVPLSAVATVAGGAPVLILRTADTPIAVSIASSLALRTVVES
jgi:hypothetical protein